MLYGRGGCWIASAVLFLCCSWLFFVTVELLVVLWPSIHIAYKSSTPRIRMLKCSSYSLTPHTDDCTRDLNYMFSTLLHMPNARKIRIVPDVTDQLPP